MIVEMGEKAERSCSTVPRTFKLTRVNTETHRIHEQFMESRLRLSSGEASRTAKNGGE